MINHLHSRFPCCPKFEFCSRYHSFCANFSQWKVSPGRKNRVVGASCDENRLDFSFLSRGGENIISRYRVGFISKLDYIGHIIFLLSRWDLVCFVWLLFFMPIYFQSIKSFNKNKWWDERQTLPSRWDTELRTDQKCYFCSFLFNLKVYIKWIAAVS